MLRNGVPIEAEVPDYRELDTVPNERRYTADQAPLESQPPGDPPSNPPGSPSSISLTDSAAFSTEAPVDAKGKEEAQADVDDKVSLTRDTPMVEVTPHAHPYLRPPVHLPPPKVVT